MGNRLATSAVLAALTLAPMQAPGQANVVSDSGETVPSMHHLVHALYGPDTDDETPLVTFPITTSLMQPGVMHSQPSPLPIAPWLTRPIFFVGDDPESANWIKKNETLLLTLGAIGVVIQVPDVQTFKRLRRSTALSLVPHEAASILRKLNAIGVQQFPILLMENGSVLQDLSQLRHAHGMQEVQ